jgi:hypothetical protein
MFYCNYPCCDYKVKDRRLIHNHHIIPKELGGTDDDYNRIFLCPNHHSKIYIPNSINGQHSIMVEGSIIIKNKYLSTNGYVLEIIDMNGHNTFIDVKI